jgi:hypothetical protein
MNSLEFLEDAVLSVHCLNLGIVKGICEKINK